MPIGQPWTGIGVLEPDQYVRQGSPTTDGYWAGWVYATDADTGVWKWRVKSNYPIVGAITPTAGGVVFFGDLGGNFYALDSSNGQKLWGQVLGSGGGIGGGIITYTVRAANRELPWRTDSPWSRGRRSPSTAKVVVLGLDERLNEAHELAATSTIQ